MRPPKRLEAPACRTGSSPQDDAVRRQCQYRPAVVRRACLVAVVLIAACTADGNTTPSTSTDATTSTSPRTTTAATTSTSATTTTMSTTTASPSTTTTTVPHVADLVTDAVQVVEFGRSVEGKPLVAVERGTPGGVVVLVIGVIHGDEDAGVAIVDRLATAPVPDGIDLWLVESMNPDGQAVRRRTNANLVDLNRNFPFGWAPLEEPGGSQYGGTGPASEPETQAMVGLISVLQPDLGIWYHQDLFRIAPAAGPRRRAAGALRRADRAARSGHQRRHLHRRRGDVAAAHDRRRDRVHRRARSDAHGGRGGGPRRCRALAGRRRLQRRVTAGHTSRNASAEIR